MKYRIALTVILLAVGVAAVYVQIKNPPPVASSSASSPALIPAEQRVGAPDFAGIDGWINSKPLTVPALHGKVVLIDFWTFSCVNCVRTLPHLHALYETYKDKGLVVVGVHSPEFDFEKVPQNVQAAVRQLGVTWPVAIDSKMDTWNAWGNQVWPAEYLIDANGKVAYSNLGEGNYDATAKAVEALLAVPAKTILASSAPTADSGSVTPEIYVGSERGSGYGLANGEAYANQGQSTTYPSGTPSDPDHVLLTGDWTDHGQYVTAGSNAHVLLRWHASSIYVVAGTGAGPLTAKVSLDGSPVASYVRGSALTQQSTVNVSRNDLFQLAQGVDPGAHLIDISVPAGFEIFTFTFG